MNVTEEEGLIDMVLAKIDHNAVKVGDEIPVRVGGIVYMTVVDDNLTQRFIHNPDHPLVKRLRMYSKGGNPEGDVASLNEMEVKYRRGEFTKREFAEMNMALGYSIDGFSDLNFFEDWEIDNPAWPVNVFESGDKS